MSPGACECCFGTAVASSLNTSIVTKATQLDRQVVVNMLLQQSFYYTDRKCHAPRCLPDVILYRSFTRSSTTLAVIPGLGMRLDYCIECFHVISSPSRLRRKKENSRHVGVQLDRSFYGDLHKRSDILIVVLICVE